MAEVNVAFLMPVSVTVDTKSGEVTAVFMHGEQMRRNESEDWMADTLGKPKPKQAQKAAQIAEEVQWPEFREWEMQ